MLGVPAEYFHRGDEEYWRDRWGVASEDAFLQALLANPATPNGVWGAKMMWNYLADSVTRLRTWPRLGLVSGASDSELLAEALPALRYVWLRRRDKLRQAISWWRADVTGQYALPAGEVAKEPPAFDREAIKQLAQFAEACDAGWRDWFTANSIQPLEIVYEDVIGDLDKAVDDVARFLRISLSSGSRLVASRLQRQADHHTERFIMLYARQIR